MVPHLLTAARGLWLGFVLTLFASALAESPSARAYLQQCLRFAEDGDLATARLSCEIALQLDPRLAEAELALARIEMALGEDAGAETRLRRLQARGQSGEVALLLAEILVRQGRFGEAEGVLATVARLEADDPESRRLFLLGQVAESRGDYRGALDFYRAAISASPATEAYHLADARLRLSLGDPYTPQRDLLAYREAARGPQSAELFSLLGRAMWAAGDLAGAARFLERAIDAWSAREGEALARDRHALVLVYYGQGEWAAGGLVLRSALSRDNLLAHLLAVALPWLLTLLLLLGLHFLGESQLEAKSGFATRGWPEPWTVSHLYGGVAFAFLAASLAALGYGYFAFDNWLAVVTPLQSADVRALYFAMLALVLLAVALRRLRLNGWEPMETLLGQRSEIASGLGLGLALLALVILYILYAPDVAWLRGFYLDYARLNLWLVVAVVLFPLSELFFRGFAIPALERRYPPALAVAISAVLFALLIGFPLPLLAVIGLSLGEAYRRTKSGLVPLVAQWTLHLGLLLGVAYSNWLRSLFL